jgi:hypothetical protein
MGAALIEGTFSVIELWVVRGEIDGDSSLPAQRKNLHFDSDIGDSLSLLHYE